ncbi:MAG: (2Fe-2S) ferredoxin domain-containing protein [Patescibacteria group bacterium]
MNIQSIPYSKVILVCGNIRTDGRISCGPHGGTELKDRLKEMCKARNLPVRVVQSSCLGQCDDGPNVLITPDNIWLSKVTMQDTDEIVKMIEKS